jgi:hypothetical protein
MGIRFDGALGLLALGVVFVGFGLFRLAHAERSGWLLIGGGVLAIAGAWRRFRHPPEK